MTSATVQLGIVEGMPAATYHAIDAVSASRLKDMRRSAAHCRHRMLHPKSTRDLLIGSAAHAAILEPDKFDREYACGGPMNPKTNQEYGPDTQTWRNYEQEQGRPVLSLAESAMLRRMAYAVYSHETASALLRPTVEGMIEVSAFWRDPATGLLCKARADKIVGKIICDLKTDRDASPRSFERSAEHWGYYLQAAWYLRGFQACGLDVVEFQFVAVEKEEPHGVSVHAYDEESMKYADGAVDELLHQYAASKESGQWDGYGTGVNTMTLSPWITGGGTKLELTFEGQEIEL